MADGKLRFICDDPPSCNDSVTFQDDNRTAKNARKYSHLFNAPPFPRRQECLPSSRSGPQCITNTFRFSSAPPCSSAYLQFTPLIRRSMTGRMASGQSPCLATRLTVQRRPIRRRPARRPHLSTASMPTAMYHWHFMWATSIRVASTAPKHTTGRFTTCGPGSRCRWSTHQATMNGRIATRSRRGRRL